MGGFNVKGLLAISRGIDVITTKLGQLMWWVSLIMVLIGAFNVLTRYAYDYIANLFGQNVAAALSGNAYISSQIFAYNLIYLLGAAYVLKSDAHVRVDIVFSKLKPKAKAWIDIFGGAFFLIPFCWLGLYFSQTYVRNSWKIYEKSSDVGGIPFFIVKTLIPVALVILIIQGISEIIKNIAFVSGHPNSGSTHAKDERGPGEHLAQNTEAI